MCNVLYYQPTYLNNEPKLLTYLYDFYNLKMYIVFCIKHDNDIWLILKCENQKMNVFLYRAQIKCDKYILKQLKQYQLLPLCL